MNTDGHRSIDQLTEVVIGCAFEVSNVLGAGFLEKVYQRALMRELTSRGLQAMAEQPIDVEYKGETVGHYVADIVVEQRLILELKCVEAIAREHLAQTLNYLRATGYRFGLILNFQKSRVEIKRVVADW